MKYLVICLDDDQRYVLATHRFFATEDRAAEYMRSINSGRCPFYVRVDREIRNEYA